MAMSRPDGLPLHRDTFDYALCDTPTFTGDTGRVHVALAEFDHVDQDLASDPISTNQRLQTNIPVLGTVVVAGPTRESIHVLVPDCTIPPVGNDVRVDLRYVVELQMGSAFDMGQELPPPDLALALTPNSLEPTLGIQRRACWEEVNPLLATWCSINDVKCPECGRVIRVNMLRHLRLMHTTHVCYWRCPVPACPLWFTSELNGKDHIEHHHFNEGRGYSFYECLQEFGQ